MYHIIIDFCLDSGLVAVHFKSYGSAITAMHLRQNVFNESHDLILIPIFFWGGGNWDFNITFFICLYESHDCM